MLDFSQETTKKKTTKCKITVPWETTYGKSESLYNSQQHYLYYLNYGAKILI